MTHPGQRLSEGLANTPTEFYWLTFPAKHPFKSNKPRHLPFDLHPSYEHANSRWREPDERYKEMRPPCLQLYRAQG